MSYSTITRAMVSYVESHVSDPRLDLKRMGQKFGFSENYIRELFASQVGVSVMHFYKRRRIILSAAQLLRTDRRILDIAVDWGFGSHGALYPGFRQSHGHVSQRIPSYQTHSGQDVHGARRIWS